MLDADFYRVFNAHIAPRTNELVVCDPGLQVPLEIASIVVIDELEVSSVGLADVTPEQRQRLQDLLDGVLSGSDAPLGCTKLIEHKIEVGDVKQIKRKTTQSKKTDKEEG